MSLKFPLWERGRRVTAKSPLGWDEKKKNRQRFTTKGNYNDIAHRPCIRVFTVGHPNLETVRREMPPRP